MSDYIECPGCKKFIKRLTSKPPKYRKHKDDRVDETCDYSGTVIPDGEETCSESDSSATTPSAPSVSPPPEGAPDPVASATSGTESSPPSPERADAVTSSGSATASGASGTGSRESLPGVDEYASMLNGLAETQLAAYRQKIDSHFSQPAPVDDPAPAPPQPTLFSQPAGAKSEAPVIEMSTAARELTARLKEIFYAYDNRRSEDNRSAQATMGPSEIGTPCDRRLALSLMRMPPVNPGGDGWAAFVGTCIHAGLEQMFMWADAGTGRFAIEQRLEYPNKHVPKGTADLIDRTLFMVDDHKCMGRWSRNKLKTQGPSRTYRVQAHVYAKGARLRGERVDFVAIIGWPRDEATLDDLYVHIEPYNPAIADEAFARVDRIAEEVSVKKAELALIYNPEQEPSEELSLEIKARVAGDFTVADDCRFCPFYLPNARDITRGCNGKQ